jgi:hypothetical protein
MLREFSTPSFATWVFFFHFAPFISSPQVCFALECALSSSLLTSGIPERTYFVLSSSLPSPFLYVFESQYTMNRRFLALFVILFAALAVLAAPVNVGTDVRIISIARV